MFYKRVKTKNEQKIEVKLKTKSKNCLIFYTGDEGLSSYLILGLSDGHIIYRVSVPGQKKAFTLKSPNKLNDNKWHTVTVER